MEFATSTNLQDVARATGVSLATVGRVLHGRAGRCAHTVERVDKVVRRLGYRPDLAVTRLARNRSVRLAFVLPSSTNSFIALPNQQVQDIARRLAERLFGFEQVMATKHLQLRLVAPIEGHDLLDRTESLVAGLLKRDPALAGLYSIGAGIRGIQAALLASGRVQHVGWVCHKLTPYARRVLLDQERIRIDIFLKDNLS